MGLDPNDDSYPAGGECTVCVDELFGGNTPTCVIAVIQGIEKCVPGHPDPPNGVFQLNQLPQPCVWQYHDGFITINWQLKVDRSIMAVALPPEHWFYAEVMSICHDAFANETDCEVAGIIGHSGYVTIWWGPQMCKGPCE